MGEDNWKKTFFMTGVVESILIDGTIPYQDWCESLLLEKGIIVEPQGKLWEIFKEAFYNHPENQADINSWRMLYGEVWDDWKTKGVYFNKLEPFKPHKCSENERPYSIQAVVEQCIPEVQTIFQERWERERITSLKLVPEIGIFMGNHSL